MRFKKVDQTLLVLGMMLIAVSFYQLFIFSSSGTKNLKALGTLSMTQSVVKTKNALALDWRDGFKGAEVSEDQLIYTDSESSADVIFIDGDRVTISENSLVKLKSNGALKGFDVNKGLIRAKVSGDKPLIVNLNGQEYALKGNGAEIQVNLQSNKGEIGVLSGNVTIESQGVEEKLNEETALNIDGKSSSKKNIAFKILTPNHNQKIYTTQNEVEVHFSWTPQENGILELANQANFENAKKFEASSAQTLKLAPDQYYFRVSNELGTSLIGTFKIIQERPPKILRPLNKSKIDVIEEENQVALMALQWVGEPSTKYKVEWEDRAEIVESSQLMVEVSKNKFLKWRVKVEESDRPDALWSPWQEVEINLIGLPILAKDFKPSGDQIQIFEETEEIQLSWSGNELSDLEVLDPNGKIEKKSIAGSSYNYRVMSSGEYRFRVRSKDVFKRVGPWSEWSSFEIENLSHQVDGDVQKIVLKRPDQEVKFSWDKKENSKTVFELSKEKNFSKVILKKEVEGDATSIIIPEVGDFYWRSQEKSVDGTFRKSRPKRVIISPTPAPSKPERLPDLKIPLKWKVLESKKTTSFFDFFISSAYAEDLKEVAYLDIPKHEDAKFYLIRIYKDPELKVLLFEKKLTTNQFEWSDVKPGVYYWQHAIIDYWERPSLFSDPSLLTITEGDVAPSEAVKLLWPIKAQEISLSDLGLRWKSSTRNSGFEWQISKDAEFNSIIKKEMSDRNEIPSLKLDLSSGLYFWRVKSFNQNGEESISNTGRFTIINSSIEKTEEMWNKNWHSRASIAFAPSKDSFSFSKNELKGTIDGVAKYGVEAKGTIFWAGSVLNVEILRQSGKVFKGENYLFQRFLVDWVKSWGTGAHRFGVGLGVGTSSGMSYDINSTQTKVIASGVGGASFGPVLRSYHAFSRKWEMQNKLAYYAGVITQMEVGAEFLKHGKSTYLIFGVSQSVRTYELNKGSQSSSRFVLGIGKEF